MNWIGIILLLGIGFVFVPGVQSEPPESQQLPPITVLPGSSSIEPTPSVQAETPAPSNGSMNGGPGDPTAPLGMNGRLPLQYSLSWMPSRPVSQQRTDLGFINQDLRISYPIWMGEKEALFGSFTGRISSIETDAILPNSRRAFPDQLIDVRTSVMYRRQFDNGWSGGLGVNFGSASDKPFQDFDTLVLGVNAFVRIPALREPDAWLVSLTYMPTSEIAFPIPGIAYQFHYGEELIINIGVPFQVTWRPTEDWQFDFNYIPVRRVRAQASYKLDPKVQLYGGFEWLNESYFLADRGDDRERFFYYEKRLPAGVRFFATEHWVFELAAGYSFDRFYFAGRNFDDRKQDRVDVKSGFFGALRVGYRF